MSWSFGQRPEGKGLEDLGQGRGLEWRLADGQLVVSMNYEDSRFMSKHPAESIQLRKRH